jgi:hypothetical protein
MTGVINMAKLEIHPSDIVALLKSYPEIEADLLAKTTAAVAETVARRVTNEQVHAHVDRCVAELVKQTTGYNTAKLAEPFAGIIHAEARHAVAEAFSANVNKKINQLIAQEIAAQMPAILKQVTAELKQNLRELMRDQLVELLLTK